MIIDSSFTWAETKDAALRIGKCLLDMKLPSNRPQQTPLKQDVTMPAIVLIHLTNCIEFLPVLLGIVAAGYAVTFASSVMTDAELATVIERTNPEVIFTSDQSANMIKRVLNERAAGKHQIRVFTVRPKGGAPITTPDGIHGTSWQQLLQSQPLSSPLPLSSQEAQTRVAAILWSSGTSGKPKGVVLSHAALIASLKSVWYINSGFTGDERWLGFIPFYHIFGLVNILLLAPCCGATLFVMSKFDPHVFLASIPQFRISTLHMAPPVALLLAKSPRLKRKNFQSVRNALSGGSPVPWEVITTVDERLGMKILMSYGLSEAGAVCNQVHESTKPLTQHQGNTGLPMHGVELKIVDGDVQESIPPNTEGVIMIRSGGMMLCYLDNPEATNEVLDSEGWFNTGDLGSLTPNGLLRITGRAKEVIKVRGFQVSPVEVEDALLESSLVADVAVAAIYDKSKATELPRAYVVPADSQCCKDVEYAWSCSSTKPPSSLQRLGNDIKLWSESRITHYKWLKGNIVFVDKIPKSPSGKIVRWLLPEARGVLVEIYGPSSERANL